ncbi:21461_t:CDS:2, partial [Gigaspora rosea]
KIIHASYWLKENNSYYSEIVIDNKNLHCLPENDDQENVAIRNTLNCIIANNNTIEWPRIDSNPINKLQIP